MRPEVLELEGFTAFRERTRVEFADAELFALTGPTGAGKSSIIDAMIFALYGSVPRLGGNAVEPVISKGRLEARIRLDFLLGEKRYTAVRVASRTARTKARLECGEATLAANVTELNEKIRELVGLDFGQFTTCVALPQGEFAKFLKQPAQEREQLLSQLLGLDIYDLVRTRAHGAQTVAEAQLNELNRQLEALAEVNQSAVKEHKARLANLEKLQELATKRLLELKALHGELDKVKTKRSDKEAQVVAVTAVQTPDAVKTLAEATIAAAGRSDQAQQALAKAGQQVMKAKARVDSLDDKAALDNLRKRHSDKDKRAADLEKAKQSFADAAKLAVEREDALREAEFAVNAAQEALAAANHAHAAHALRVHLAVGEPCPVCQQEVDILPTSGDLANREELESTLVQCQHQRDDAQELHMDAAKEHVAAEVVWKTKQNEWKELEAKLHDQPPLPEVEKQIAAIKAASHELDAAERYLAKAKTAADDATKALEHARGREAKEWNGYHSQRDELAGLSLSPPMPGTALIEAWSNLEAWAQEQAPELRKRAAEFAEQARKLEHQNKNLHDDLHKAFEKHDLPFDEAKALVAVATAVSKAQSAFDDIRNKLAEKRKRKKEARAAQSEAGVAKELAKHLTGSGFRRWLLTAAFDRLVSGASDVLRELSNGQYTFHHNGKFEFDVVDHANAGETRSAKTLSGGETFLASLALALTLAEHISDLAAAGTARLESIFLDEGFGALDGETLDTVATAIEELSTKGRTVGIVTHVAELAERVPVRFKVSKTAATAVVERVAS